MNTIIKKLSTALLVAAFTITGFGLTANTADAAHYDRYTSAQKDQIIDILLKLSIARAGSSSQPMASTPAADLRVLLNKQLQGHVGLGLQTLYAVIDGENYISEANSELDDNTNDLAASIGSVFGENAENAFDEIWTDHIGFFANYATGLRENDQDMMLEAREDLAQYQQDIAAFFTSALPMIKKETVINGSGEHAALFFDSMDAWDEGDYEEAYDLQTEAAMQIQGIADLLATNIVKKFPSKF